MPEGSSNHHFLPLLLEVPNDQFQKTSFLSFTQDHEFTQKHHMFLPEVILIYLMAPQSYSQSLVWQFFCFWLLVNHKRHQHFIDRTVTLVFFTDIGISDLLRKNTDALKLRYLENVLRHRGFPLCSVYIINSPNSFIFDTVFSEGY